jgi:hypothetical protein
VEVDPFIEKPAATGMPDMLAVETVPPTLDAWTAAGKLAGAGERESTVPDPRFDLAFSVKGTSAK